MDTKPGNYPLMECVRAAEELLKQPNVLVFQKYTCEHCDSRQTVDVPNTFYRSGMCEECMKITDIEKHGCNYLVVMGVKK